MTYFGPEFNAFFRELAPNNQKDWFDENRKRYEQHVKIPFQKFVQAAIQEVSLLNPAVKDLEPKDAIFRINRDIRFSKDKSPYKLQMSAVIGPGGKKNFAGNGLYFELTPEHVRFYAGIYEANKDQLLAVRQGIAANLDTFQKLYRAPEFVNLFGEIRGAKNKILPKELKSLGEKEPLLYNKQFYFFCEHSEKLTESEDLMSKLLEAYRVAQPLQNFFSKLVS